MDKSNKLTNEKRTIKNIDDLISNILIKQFRYSDKNNYKYSIL